MSYSLVYFPTETLYKIALSGRVEASEIVRAFQEVAEGTSGPSTANIMWDFRSADLRDINFSDVMTLLLVRQQTNTQRGNPKVAFLVDSDAVYGKVRIWTNLLEGEPAITQTVGLFRDEAETIAWLKDTSASTDQGSIS